MEVHRERRAYSTQSATCCTHANRTQMDDENHEITHDDKLYLVLTNLQLQHPTNKLTRSPAKTFLGYTYELLSQAILASLSFIAAP